MKLTPKQLRLVIDQMERRRIELERIDSGRAAEMALIVSKLGEEYMERINIT